MLRKRLENYYPRDWENSRYYSKYSLTEVSSSSMEYLTLKMNMMGNKTISRIVRVECPQLYGYFLLKKAEYQSRGISVTVRELYHDTAEWKIDPILKTNLDWRMVVRYKYGQGVSFSPSMRYANQQSSRGNGSHRAMIVADVLVGGRHMTSSAVRLPILGNDTTVGNGGQVYVKFYDNEFYPKMIFMKSRKRRRKVEEYESRGINLTVKELYHDTAERKIDSILRTNLDWRMVARCKYGRGVSFSPSTSYANRQSSRGNGSDRAMIVADVLVGAEYYTFSSMRLPDGDNDTAVGNCGYVYVKFYDNEFYPKYIMYYNN